MRYYVVADSFFSQRNFVADSLQAKCDFIPKLAVLRFWVPLGDLGATYDDHLRLIGKRVVDFFSLGVTAEELRKNIDWKLAFSLQCGRFDPNFSGRRGAATNHSFSQKTRLNDLSYGAKIWTDFLSVLSQFTPLTDGRTDRQTEFSSLDRVCIPCSEVKTRISAVTIREDYHQIQPTDCTDDKTTIFYVVLRETKL